MSIKRAKRSNNYTVLSNKVFESNLSWRAIGVLGYLLSKPDDWQVSIANLVNHTKSSKSPLGRDGVYAVISELVDAGFIKREQKNESGGKFGSIEYTVYDEPLPAQPYAAEPYTANPRQLSTDNKQYTEDNQKRLMSGKIPDDSQRIVADVFEYWRNAMNKTNGAKLTAGRRDKIKARLKDGYTYEQMTRAIDGCLNSPFHMGDNDSGAQYNDITLIFRSGDKLEQFMAIPYGSGNKADRKFNRNLTALLDVELT
jgi:hypothetical protein